MYTGFHASTARWKVEHQQNWHSSENLKYIRKNTVFNERPVSKQSIFFSTSGIMGLESLEKRARDLLNEIKANTIVEVITTEFI